MAKQKISKIIPVRIPTQQMLLFPDMFTDTQEQLLELADGSRTLESLSERLALEMGETEAIVEQLLRGGHLRAATLEEIQTALATMPGLGRHEDAIRLARYVLTQRHGDISTLTLLANTLETTARPQEAAAQWQFLSQIYLYENRPNDALPAARRAAALQPFTPALQNDLAELCLQTGRPAEAARCWCAYARRLAESGKTEDALAVLDYAQRKIPADDMLMYTEAEILAVRDGYPKRDNLPPNLLKKKFIASGNPGAAFFVFAVVFGVAAVLLFAVYDYTARERQLAVSTEIEKDLLDIAALPLARKVRNARRIVEKMTAAAPLLPFMETAEFREVRARAASYAAKAESELQKSRERHQQQLARWRAAPTVANEDILCDLLLLDDTESPAFNGAREEWKKWRELKKKADNAKPSLPPAADKVNKNPQ